MQKSAQKTLASQDEEEKGGYQRLGRMGGVGWDKSGRQRQSSSKIRSCSAWIQSTVSSLSIKLYIFKNN